MLIINGRMDDENNLEFIKATISSLILFAFFV